MPSALSFSHSQTGQSPLMLAVSRGRMEMVELCLEARADINATDEVRHTMILSFVACVLFASH